MRASSDTPFERIDTHSVVRMSASALSAVRGSVAKERSAKSAAARAEVVFIVNEEAIPKFQLTVRGEYLTSFGWIPSERTDQLAKELHKNPGDARTFMFSDAHAVWACQEVARRAGVIAR